MKSTAFNLKKLVASSSVAMVALLAAPLAAHIPGVSLVSKAYAAEGDGGTKAGASKGQHGSTGGHGQEKGGKGKSDVMMKGQGGPGAESDSDRPDWAGVKGGKAGGGTKPGTAGTKKGDLYGDLYVILRNPDGTPVLDDYGHQILIAADGSLIYLTPEGEVPTGAVPQTVEFSRLSVSRASTKVIDKQLADAEKTIQDATKVTFDEAGRILYTKADGTTATIDSPLANLALYQAILKNNGTLTLPTATGTITLNLTNAAAFLGAASDKTGAISVDTVEYLNPILGITGTISYDGKTYYDYTNFTYDRTSTYDQKVKVGTLNADNTVTWTETTLSDAVFKTAPTATTNAAGFAQAADDARAVIQFIHDTTLLQFVQ